MKELFVGENLSLFTAKSHFSRRAALSMGNLWLKIIIYVYVHEL